MYNSGDIFQAKVDEMLGDIEFVKICINDILVLSKERIYKHIEQPMIIFGRLCAAGLNVNSTKCSVVLKEIPYLRYVIPWEGIKTDPNKLQGFIDTGRSTTMT